jgi:2-polyprenyl-6-methoxyphenol hydroxylase-like FAD-dependent oxidoreductase
MGSALALARQGFTDIDVLESAPALGEVGAGINIPPNLARLLAAWGVLDIAQAEGVVITKTKVLGRFSLLLRGRVGSMTDHYRLCRGPDPHHRQL